MIAWRSGSRSPPIVHFSSGRFLAKLQAIPVPRFMLAFTFAALMPAQQEPTELLRLVRTKIADSLDRLPRYMCTQTVDRATFAADVNEGGGTACDEGSVRRSTHLISSDRLRLDVAM